MPIAINGSGTITGVSVGGLPDGIVDTDMLAAAAVTGPKKGTGSILQVVSASQTSTFATSSTSFVDVTNATLNITPISSSNKIYVTMQGGRFGMFSGASYYSEVQVLRDSTVILFTQPSSRDGNPGNDNSSAALSILDSPNTTSQITYKVQVKSSSSSGSVNVVGTQTGSALTITAMEVVA